MRDPKLLLEQMGIAGFAVFQLLIAGMLISALVHPWLLFFVGSALIGIFVESDTKDLTHSILLAVDIFNAVSSYVVFILLGLWRMTSWERRALRFRWLLLPFYWLLLSAAAWRAVWQLRSNPFFWEKTPHLPSRKPA